LRSQDDVTRFPFPHNHNEDDKRVEDFDQPDDEDVLNDDNQGHEEDFHNGDESMDVFISVLATRTEPVDETPALLARARRESRAAEETSRNRFHYLIDSRVKGREDSAIAFDGDEWTWGYRRLSKKKGTNKIGLSFSVKEEGLTISFVEAKKPTRLYLRFSVVDSFCWKVSEEDADGLKAFQLHIKLRGFPELYSEERVKAAGQNATA
jgi:hypothetical protein